jgi:hypothetical protein
LDDEMELGEFLGDGESDVALGAAELMGCEKVGGQILRRKGRRGGDVDSIG